MRKHWAAFVALGLVVLVIAGLEMRTGIIRGLWCIETTGIREKLLRRSFDSVAWQSKHATDGDYSIRSRMVDDLISSKRLSGMDRKQVTKLLGKPDNLIGNQYWYSLGEERGYLKVDWEALEITFSSGRVVKVETSVH